MSTFDMMTNMDTKVTGYTLITAGLVIITLAALSVFSIYKGNSRPVKIFDFPSVEISAESLMGGDLPPEQRALLKQSGEAPKIEILDGKILSDTSNLIAHLFIMGFLASIGARIASIGTKLVRPIIVDLNTTNGQKVQKK